MQHRKKGVKSRKKREGFENWGNEFTSSSKRRPEGWALRESKRKTEMQRRNASVQEVTSGMLI